MTALGPYEVHPVADLFPLIEGEEFDALVADIMKHGLGEPIVLTHDQSTIVDGRNRYRACMAAGVDPRFRQLPAQFTEPVIVAFIISANINRRQLNAGQRALLGAEMTEWFEKEAKKRQEDALARGRAKQNGSIVADRPQSGARGPLARDDAAAAVGAAPRTVQRAKALLRDAPELAKQVRSGAVTLDAAEKERKRRTAQDPKEPKPKATSATITLVTHEGVEVPYPKPKGKATFNETTGEGISWAAWSWNPVTGCLHDCKYCYAREIATSHRYAVVYPVGFTPLFHHERLGAPANTKIPAAHVGDPSYRRVFVCSMADLYGKWVPAAWINQVHEAMLASPEWEYQLLTKFPSRYLKFELPPRAWVGTSVDTQRRVHIAEQAFAKLNGVAVKWLSLEPLREPLTFTDLSMFDWVVIGGQTETHQPDGVVPAFAPPFEWVADIVSQARDAGCAVHMKPNLRIGPGMELLDEYPGT